MYILNPTKDQLDAWYKCENRTGRFIVEKYKVSPIHRTKNNYYFVLTEYLKDCLKTIPFWIKIYEIF